MELDVQKSWYGDTASDRPAEVKVDLWQSSEPKLPANVPKVKVIVTHKYHINYPAEDVEVPYVYEFNAKNNDYFMFNLGEYTNEQGVLSWDDTLSVQTSGNWYIPAFKSKEPITADTTFNVTVSQANLTSAELMSEPGIVTSPQFDEATATKVQTVTLNAANNWHADFDTSTLDSLKYYYITEQTVDGYYASYEATGLRDGTFELTNFKDNIPRGSLKIDKQWLEDEANVTSLEFTVKGFTKKVDQETSDYATKNAQSEPDMLYVNASQDGLSADTAAAVKFKIEPNSTYYVQIGGRDFFTNNVNGIVSDLTYAAQPKTDGTDNGVVYKITTGDSVNKVNNFNVSIGWSAGLSEAANWNAPVADVFTVNVRDESNNVVKVYGQDETVTEISPSASDETYDPATVTLPENEEPYIERTLTMVKTAGKWSGEVKNLPLNDDYGNDIYYYVEEASGNGYVPINYSDNGFTLTQDGEKTVTVLNQTTEQTGFELPETGGEGVWLYYITGAGLMMTSALFIHIKKRRRAS